MKAGRKEGGEIQTLGGGSGIGFKCNYGYYEVRMKLPKVPGICASFFRIGNQYAGNPEIDLEFLTPDFAATPGRGRPVPGHSVLMLPWAAGNPTSVAVRRMDSQPGYYGLSGRRQEMPKLIQAMEPLAGPASGIRE